MGSFRIREQSAALSIGQLGLWTVRESECLAIRVSGLGTALFPSGPALQARKLALSALQRRNAIGWTLSRN